jgi:hypothetical protein
MSRGAGEKTIDWYGFFLMMIGIGALVSAIIQGPEWGWRSAMTILFFLISVISLASLYIVENRVKSPIIDFKLFMSRGFLSGALPFHRGLLLIPRFFMPLTWGTF